MIKINNKAIEKSQINGKEVLKIMIGTNKVYEKVTRVDVDWGYNDVTNSSNNSVSFTRPSSLKNNITDTTTSSFNVSSGLYLGLAQRASTSTPQSYTISTSGTPSSDGVSMRYGSSLIINSNDSPTLNFSSSASQTVYGAVRIAFDKEIKSVSQSLYQSNDLTPTTSSPYTTTINNVQPGIYLLYNIDKPYYSSSYGGSWSGTKVSNTTNSDVKVLVSDNNMRLTPTGSNSSTSMIQFSLIEVLNTTNLEFKLSTTNNSAVSKCRGMYKINF